MTTTVADVLVIYATMPFVAAGMALVINGERVSRRTLVAAGVAMIGVVVMVASGLGSGRLLGQALSLLMTATFALMAVLQRRDPSMSMTSINAAAAFVAATFGYSSSPHPSAQRSRHRNSLRVRPDDGLHRLRHVHGGRQGGAFRGGRLGQHARRGARSALGLSRFRRKSGPGDADRRRLRRRRGDLARDPGNSGRADAGRT